VCAALICVDFCASVSSTYSQYNVSQQHWQ